MLGILEEEFKSSSFICTSNLPLFFFSSFFCLNLAVVKSWRPQGEARTERRVLSEARVTVRLSRTDPDPWWPPSITPALANTRLKGKEILNSVFQWLWRSILLPLGSAVWQITWGEKVRIIIICLARNHDLSVLDNISATASYRLWRLPPDLSVCQVTYEPPCCALLRARSKDNNLLFNLRTNAHPLHHTWIRRGWKDPNVVWRFYCASK